MKTFALVRYAAVAVLVGAPLFAQAADVDSVQRCMDAYAAQNFADRTVSFAIDQGIEGPRSSVFGITGTQHVQLIATERVTGRVLATARCAVKRNAPIGQVSISALIPKT